MDANDNALEKFPSEIELPDINIEMADINVDNISLPVENCDSDNLDLNNQSSRFLYLRSVRQIAPRSNLSGVLMIKLRSNVMLN